MYFFCFVSVQYNLIHRRKANGLFHLFFQFHNIYYIFTYMYECVLCHDIQFSSYWKGTFFKSFQVKLIVCEITLAREHLRGTLSSHFPPDSVAKLTQASE